MQSMKESTTSSAPAMLDSIHSSFVKRCLEDCVSSIAFYIANCGGKYSDIVNKLSEVIGDKALND